MFRPEKRDSARALGLTWDEGHVWIVEPDGSFDARRPSGLLSAGGVRFATNDGAPRDRAPADLSHTEGLFAVTVALDVWAFGDAGTIVGWKGLAWFSASSGLAQSYFSVWGSGPNGAWAVADLFPHASEMARPGAASNTRPPTSCSFGVWENGPNLWVPDYPLRTR